MLSTSAVKIPTLPLNAASLRALDALGVGKYVESLGISSADADKLVKQDVDGAALLDMTEDKLRSCGVSLGHASAIMRAIKPAIDEATAVTLTVFPPLKKGSTTRNGVKVTLTPNTFLQYLGTPLRLVSKDGAILRDIMSLKEAVEETTRNPTAFLRASRSFDDDLAEVRGFVGRVAEALEQETTRALVGDASLLSNYGPLTAVNSAEHFSIKRIGRKMSECEGLIEIDGLVVGTHGVALLNSAKHSPSVEHVDAVLTDAIELQLMLASLNDMTTDPSNVKGQLTGVTSVLPFLCGNELSAVVAARCVKVGVGILRPSGDRFVVEALPRCLPPAAAALAAPES